MGEAKRNPSATDTMRGLYDGLRLAASTHPCMIEIVLILVEGASKIMASLGKPSHPEDRPVGLSLTVDWLPALFANTAEYPRLRACIRKDGSRICRMGGAKRNPSKLTHDLHIKP